MESKLTQKGWMAVVIWFGLLAGTAFTSNSVVTVFGQIIQALFQTLTNGISDLFQNYGILFATLLGIVLIFLLVSAWLGLVSFTFEVSALVFGSEAEDDLDLAAYPGQVARYLGFAWGLFYILFLILPMVM